MLKNYLKIAWRSLVKNRVTAIINILGLSVGISAALIIFMVVHYNFSFDRFVPGRDYVYRIVTEGEGWNNSGVPVPFHTALHNISGVADVTPILNYSDKVKISINEGNNTEPKLFRKQTDVAFTNMEYFKIFPHKWIAGNQQKALGNPYSIVITNSRAKQYFPDLKPENVIGKTVILNDTITTTVTGIVNDLEVNSDFDKMIFVSLPTATLGNLKDYFNWKHWDNTNSSFQTIIKLLPGIKPEQINNQLAKVFKERDPGNTKTIHRLSAIK